MDSSPPYGPNLSFVGLGVEPGYKKSSAKLSQRFYHYINY